MKILHIVRSLDEERSLAVAQAQAIEHQVTVLLLHDAVLRRVDPAQGLEVYAGQDDVLARGARTPYPVLDYDGIVRAIFAHDRVISW